jgi:hypothetical protein
MNSRREVPVDPVTGWAELPPVARPSVGRRVVSALFGGLIVGLVYTALSLVVRHPALAHMMRDAVRVGVAFGLSSFFFGWAGSKPKRSLSEQYRGLAR